jgi:hypothetical protein
MKAKQLQRLARAQEQLRRVRMNTAPPEHRRSPRELLLSLVKEHYGYLREAIRVEIDAGNLVRIPHSISPDHDVTACDACKAWQNEAHQVFLARGIDSAGELTDAGLYLKILAMFDRWPIRDDTKEVLNSKLRRQAEPVVD